MSEHTAEKGHPRSPFEPVKGTLANPGYRLDPNAVRVHTGETQTILATPELQAQGIYGNCVQAALATLLRRPMDSVPHVGLFSLWEHAMLLWLRGEGLDFTLISGSEIPTERAMLVGRSPRGYMHAVVSEGGRIAWDPHPSRDGLTTVTGAYVIHEWVNDDEVRSSPGQTRGYGSDV